MTLWYIIYHIFCSPGFNILSQFSCFISIILLQQVSSFDTVAKQDEEKEKEKGKEDVLSLQMPRGCDEKDFIRWRNSIGRDFTINR
jgi:hypothetical protein